MPTKTISYYILHYFKTIVNIFYKFFLYFRRTKNKFKKDIEIFIKRWYNTRCKIFKDMQA